MKGNAVNTTSTPQNDLQEPFNATVKDWITVAGLRAVVMMHRHGGHHCGYVGVPASHPFYGKSYSSPAPAPFTRDFLADKPVGKRGAIDLMCFAAAGDNSPPDLGILFDVHGGITYSGGERDYPIKSDGLWWFGYDCAHAGDKTKWSSDGMFRDEAYCAAECESLAQQLVDLAALATIGGGK